MPKIASLASNAPSEIAPQNHLDILRKAHRDLTELVKEVPASRSPSPRTEKRVENLRDKVREAYDVARGDTADGKWVHLAEMLRMGCTRPRYKRWVAGVRTGDGERKEEAGDWISPETELEFMQWKHDTNLKEKVENWKSRIDAVPHTGSIPPSVPISLENNANDSSMGSTKSKGGNGQTQDLKSSSGLGFPVVKHASLTATGVKRAKANGHSNRPKGTPALRIEGRHQVPGSKSQQNASDSSPAQLPPPPHNIEMARSGPGKDKILIVDELSSPPPKEISEVPEMPFLPPSFPSQLRTSTPHSRKEMPPAPAREKPPPIPLRSEAFLSSPPFSPPFSSQAHPNPILLHMDKDFLSSSLPLLSPTLKRPRPLTPPPDDINAVFSRQSLLQTPPQPLKKARTMPAFHTGDSSGPPPTTPPRSTTPKSLKNLVKASELPESSTPSRQLPTLTELLASAKKSKALRSSSRKISSPTTRDGMQADQGKGKHKSGELEGSPSSHPHHSSGSVQPSRPTRDGLYGGNHFTQNPGTFAPGFTSSQLPPDLHDVHMGGMGSSGGVRGSNSFLGTGYNSQFDLEGQIDRVSELLERDVDFDGWLRDIPEVEETRIEDADEVIL